MHLALIGVPYNSAGLRTGEARAPAALRAAGLVSGLRKHADVIDYGDVAFDPPTPNRDPVTGIVAPRTLASMVGSVQRAVERALAADRFPLVVGGECPLLLGCLAAARGAYHRLGLLFVDGHEDAWPAHRSTTGEAADMELGFALGRTGGTGIDELDQILPLVQTTDTVVLGPRDRDELATAGVSSIAADVPFYDAVALRRVDLRETVRSHTRHLQRNAGHWWFHLDLDVLATAALPAVRYPQPGGLEWAELEIVAETALATTGLVGWNITIYNPELDSGGAGAARIVALLEALVDRIA